MVKKKPPAEPAPKAPKHRQGYIDPAMAPVVVSAVEDAAEDYRAARDARTRCGEQEQEAAETLLQLMNENHLTEYTAGANRPL